MPIEMILIKRSHLNKEDLYCPFFVCDVCRQVISHYGNYQYKVGRRGEDYPSITPIFYTHKKCCMTLEYNYPAGEQELWMSGELSKFPLYLYTNLVDPDVTIDSPLALYLGIYGMQLSDFVESNDRRLSRPGLYFLFDDDELVYIGKSKNIKKRLIQHHIYQKDYHQIKMTSVIDSLLLDDLEKALILLCKPRLNTVYNNA